MINLTTPSSQAQTTIINYEFILNKLLKYLKKILTSVQYASIKTFISTELNNNQSLSNNDSISSLLQTKHNVIQDNEKKLKLSYDFSNLLTCPKQNKPVKINISNIKQPYPNSYRTLKQQHTSNTSNNNHNGKDIHSLYTIIKPNSNNNNNNNKKCAHSKESKTQSNSKSTSRDKSNHKGNYNSCNYNYINHHNKQLCSSDNNTNKMNSIVITSYNNKKHTSNTLKQTFSDNSGGPLLNEKLFSKLNLKPYTTSSTSNNNISNSNNNMNTPSSIVNTTTSIIKTKENKKHDNTSINLNIYCHNNITNNNIKNVHIKQINTSSKTKKANSNTSHSNSNTNRSHYHSSINSYRSNRLGKKSNANINLTNTNNYISTTTTSKHKYPKQNTTYLIPKKKISKKKLNKSKQEHTIVVNYNNGQLPLMIVNKKDKHESYEVIEHIREEYIDLSEPDKVINDDNECKNEHVVIASSSTHVVKEDKKVSRKSSSKHSRDQNTKGNNNKNTKNEEIIKQIKNSLDDNLKVMFNFSYENFLSKESETESKKSSEQEIFITESYEA